MAQKSTSAVNQIVGLSIAVLLLATIGILGLNLLFASNNYSTVTDESFVGLNLTGVQLANTQPLTDTDSVVVTWTNGSVIIPDSGTNYTITLPGVITIDSTTYMTNNTAYLIDYHYGAVNTTVSTLAKTVVGLVLAIVFIIIILKYAGIKIK